MKHLKNLIVTLILIIGILGCIEPIVEAKASRNKFQEFYEQEENFDVLFVGTSHVLNGISPMHLWERNGIVSYNIATSGSRMPTAYWVLKNALQHTEPKLVVVDCAYMNDQKVNKNVNYNHTAFDFMPLSKLKFEAITDLYDTKEKVLRYLFPFALYHSRWNEITDADITYQSVGKMGYFYNNGVTISAFPEQMAGPDTIVNNVGTEYLEKIIQECQSRNIDVLLTYIPFNVNEESQKHAAFTTKIAEKYGVNYLNPNELLEIINLKTDYHNNNNNNSHMNLSGAHKLSYYLGDYILQTYDRVQDQRNNPQYAQWHQYHQAYKSFMLSQMRESTTLETYLLCLYDPNYRAIVQINNRWFFENNTIAALLENLGVRNVQIQEQVPCTFITDTNGTTVQMENVELALEWFDGEGTMQSEQKQEVQSFSENGDICFAVFDSKTNELLDIRKFLISAS